MAILNHNTPGFTKLSAIVYFISVKLTYILSGVTPLILLCTFIPSIRQYLPYARGWSVICILSIAASFHAGTCYGVSLMSDK